MASSEQTAQGSAPRRSQPPPRVVVGCPDARPPAYQAAAGLARSEMLDCFLTSFYYGGDERVFRWAKIFAPTRLKRWEPWLKRRQHPEIPSQLVHPKPGFDLALAIENRLGARQPGVRHRIAQWRTEHFDNALANTLKTRRPQALLVFSDVGSEITLPLCQRLGIPSILSMVHGDVREEQTLLIDEQRLAPEHFPLYLGDSPIDRDELGWLHRRRLQDIALADLILVPSDHIANELKRHGTSAERIRVIPYAADVQKFTPDANKTFSPDSCTFIFAGGVSQRKGVKYLLEAWRQVKQPGWKLQLVGALPTNLGPLADPLNDESIEPLGRVGHAQVSTKLAQADVFVFPSLFEGSAVVTYEAMACGLPIVTTPNAGSVARDGLEGLITSIRDVDALAKAMQRLGQDVELRRRMSLAARQRALEFDWIRYHESVNSAILETVASHPVAVAS